MQSSSAQPVECGPRRIVRSAAYASLLALLLTGCRPAVEPPDARDKGASTHVPVRVLVVDDPSLAEAVARQWGSRSDRAVEVRQTGADQLRQSTRLQADVILFPSGLLGELAQSKQIVPLNDDTFNGPQIDRRDVFPVQWRTEARWGRKVYAAPLGSPQFCLLYRSDVLESIAGEVPTRWSDYAALAKAMAHELQAMDQAAGVGQGTRHGLAEPLAEGWAGQVLLARAAPYARHRSYYSTLFDFGTMEPLIDGPPFVRALEELVAVHALAPPESLDWTPADVRNAFWQGRLAMGMTWPSATTPSNIAGIGSNSAGIGVLAAFAELPGSTQVYRLGEDRWESRREDEPSRIPLTGIAGRLGAVTREARRPGEAADVLSWICGKDWSSQIARRSSATTLFRKSQVVEPQRWVAPEAAGVAEEYAKLVEKLQSRTIVLTSLRIPGRKRYLAALDEAVRSAVRGQASPADALATAAEKWRSISEELGLDSQREAYSRSLGLKP